MPVAINATAPSAAVAAQGGRARRVLACGAGTATGSVAGSTSGANSTMWPLVSTGRVTISSTSGFADIGGNLLLNTSGRRRGQGFRRFGLSRSLRTVSKWVSKEGYRLRGVGDGQVPPPLYRGSKGGRRRRRRARHLVRARRVCRRIRLRPRPRSGDRRGAEGGAGNRHGLVGADDAVPVRRLRHGAARWPGVESPPPRRADGHLRRGPDLRRRLDR